MFAKFATLIFAFSFLVTHSFAASQDGLKAAFEELKYNLVVEWDQKDQKFHDQKMEQFVEKLQSFKAQGLTSETIVNFLKTEVRDERVAQNLEAAFNMVAINKLSHEEAMNYLVESMDKTQDVGASYRGIRGYPFALLIFIAVFPLILSSVNNCASTYACDYTNHCYYVCY